MTISPQLLEILACPQCKGPVREEHGADRLVCDTCRLAYPVRDDIPVMLVDETCSLDPPAPTETDSPSG